MPGPPPKRSDQRRRRNKPPVEPTQADAGEVEWHPPEPDEKWHRVAKVWWDSLRHSGQSVFYVPTDWAAAYAIAESMSREFKPHPIVVQDGDGQSHIEWVERPPSGAALGSWLRGMTALLATEGDRRRAALELQRQKPAEEVPDVSELASYRQRLQSG